MALHAVLSATDDSSRPNPLSVVSFHAVGNIELSGFANLGAPASAPRGRLSWSAAVVECLDGCNDGVDDDHVLRGGHLEVVTDCS